jgi:hypothetical protein
MVAPIALLCDLPSWIDVPNAIWAGSHAVSASDTPVWIDIDDPIRAFNSGIDRAYSHTDRIFTIIAHDRKGIFSHVRIMPFLDLFDPGSPYTERDIIFAFADYGTCIAANTLSEIEKHSVFF